MPFKIEFILTMSLRVFEAMHVFDPEIICLLRSMFCVQSFQFSNLSYFSPAKILGNWRWQGEVVEFEQIIYWNISLVVEESVILNKVIYRGLVLWTELVVQELRNNCCFADPEIFNIYSVLNILQYVDLTSIFWMLNNISFVLLFFLNSKPASAHDKHSIAWVTAGLWESKC